jgi:hypothetical protein
MKNKIFSAFLLGSILLLILPVAVFAQQPAYIVSSTSPISAELRQHVDDWLAVSPPSNNIYFAVTYTQESEEGAYLVCLVALDLASPDEEWSFTGMETAQGTTPSKVSWFGTIKVFADGDVVLLTEAAEGFATSAAKLARSTQPGPGGSASIRFPWQPSKAVRYGRAGVHPVGHGYVNPWRMVDFHSGTDMGSGAASDRVYASAAGEVTWVCDDDTTMIVQIDDGEDYFLYADLLENANLELEHNFAQSETIGFLKHGTYVDTCGTALQTEDHWRLRWGFQKGSNNTFQAEGCILTGIVENYTVSSAAVWGCGTEKIKPGDILTHYGNIPTDDFGSVQQPKFFTMLLDGLNTVFDVLVGNLLPEHNSPSAFILPILNGVKIIFRIVNVLLRGNFNFAPAMIFVGLTISVRLALGSVYLAGAIIRIIKSIPFVP